MHRIIYFSAAPKELTKEEINSLFVTTKASNQKMGITGLLVHIDGNFLHIIEGKKENVLQILETSKTDELHKYVIPVYNKSIPKRIFKEWFTGCSAQDFTELKQSPKTNPVQAISDKMVNVFLDTFQKSHRNQVVYI